MPQKRAQHPRCCTFDPFHCAKMALKNTIIHNFKKICSKLVKIGGMMADHVFEAWSDALKRMSSLLFSSCLVKASIFAWALLSLALAILFVKV